MKAFMQENIPDNSNKILTWTQVQFWSTVAPQVLTVKEQQTPKPKHMKILNDFEYKNNDYFSKNLKHSFHRHFHFCLNNHFWSSIDPSWQNQKPMHKGHSEEKIGNLIQYNMVLNIGLYFQVVGYLQILTQLESKISTHTMDKIILVSKVSYNMGAKYFEMNWRQGIGHQKLNTYINST